MTRIFISYRRDDSAGHVGRLYDRLVEQFRPDDIFMDIDTISPGEDFVDAVERAVAAADVLLAVIGQHWLTVTDRQGRRRLDNPHDFVRLEIAAALKRNIRVIPVLLRGTPMPDMADLPEDLQPLVRRNAVEIGEKTFHYDVDELMSGLKQLRSAPGKTTVRGSNRGRSAVVQPILQKATDVAVLPQAALIVTSALIVAAASISVALALPAPSPPLAYIALGMAWLVQGPTAEAILYRAGYITRRHSHSLGSFITTALMGAAANGLLLRRAGIPLPWWQALLVAAGWIGAFFLVVELADTVFNEFSPVNVFIAGFSVGALGGTATAIAASSVRPR